jgi:predicted MPP superfamily phosphohydrolase
MCKKIIMLNQNEQLMMKNYILPQASFSNGISYGGSVKVCYISDIHLGHHINIDQPIESQIKKMVDVLFRSKEDGSVILFGGDISSDTRLCTMFYHKFMIRWNYEYYKKWKQKNGHFQAAISRRKAKQEIEKQMEQLENKRKSEILIIRKWFRYDKRHEGMSRWQIEELISHKEIPDFIIYHIRIIKSIEQSIQILIENKIYEIEKLTRDLQYKMQEDLPIFTVLGNHELHAFDSVNEAVDFYNNFFKGEKIHFLHNSVEKINKSHGLNSFSIVGGAGLAKYNEKYNANTVIGARTMTRNEEIKESEKFFQIYQEGLAFAKEKQIPLMVLSHYPTKDWLPNNEYDSHCYYFTGHTHRDNSVHSEKFNVYANNQIGYLKKDIRFKQAVLGMIYNPFIDYEDGYFEISIKQYIQFYNYCGDSIQGAGFVERQLETGNAKFYAIKKQGFYGFFVVNQRTGTKICAGGRIKTISNLTDINYFNESFSGVVMQYIEILAPYRKIQEKLSAEIKSLGFSGKIHGCIIDVDFFNHVMVNPLDGQVTYYYSPTFGMVLPYESFSVMLDQILQNGYLIEKQSNGVIEQYKKMLEYKKDNLITQNSQELSEYVDQMVNIKNSVYAFSNRMNQLQRLFESNILRDWNEELAKLAIDDITKYLPQKTSSLVGKVKRMKCGILCTVIEDNDENDISVKFSNDEVVEHIARTEFANNRIKPPSYVEQRVMKKRVESKDSFAKLYPDLLVDWDYKENSVDPNQVRDGDTMEASWICNICATKWKAKLQKRCTGKSLCPNCRHRVIIRDAKLRKTKEDR